MVQYIRTKSLTDKAGCRLLAEALNAYGVRHVVLSPGSRNAPLIMIFARSVSFKTYSVVDERSAAFIGLGIAEISGEPVALVCTSGSALLNYAPALAEAYYRHIPLIAISADRPEEWIDQNDSQTIQQPGALKNVVRGSVSLKGELQTSEEIDFHNRKLNDILQLGLYGIKGPVHININLSMPLTRDCEGVVRPLFHKIDRYEFNDKIPVEWANIMASKVLGQRILVIGSISAPDSRISKAIAKLANLSNVAVICEGLSNVHASGVLHRCDILFSGNIEDEQLDLLSPDVLISFGGAPVSERLKSFLRKCNVSTHWHIGKNDNAIDCFRKLSARIEATPESFFPRFASALTHLSRCGKNKSENISDYSHSWSEYARQVILMREELFRSCADQFNAISAVDCVLESVPANWNVQLGNGMAVRYALACDKITQFHRVDSNRGVSGIEGCLSTAVGASLIYSGTTLLLAGDMSTSYDLAALASHLLSPKLKIVILNNRGGGIFHYVKTTCNLPELKDFFSCQPILPMEKLSEAYGIRYLKATDLVKLKDALDTFVNENSKSVCLEIFTNPDQDADYFRKITGE